MRTQTKSRQEERPMKIVLDTHAHTIVSGHAYNTIREMAQMAKEKGLEAFALTEHAPQMPGTCHEFYFQNLHIVPREMYGVRLFMGVELNIMNEKERLTFRRAHFVRWILQLQVFMDLVIKASGRKRQSRRHTLRQWRIR